VPCLREGAAGSEKKADKTNLCSECYWVEKYVLLEACEELFVLLPLVLLCSIGCEAGSMSVVI
jgi:hypothetical protein